MAAAFQNRLVGTIIAVALAVIFLPELLDGEKRQAKERFESIPARPAVKALASPESFPTDLVKSKASRKVEIVNDVAVDEPTTPNTETGAVQEPVSVTPKPATSRVADPVMEPRQERVEAGWVVQLGSFKHQKNVRQLLRKLEQAGYRTFTRPVKTSNGNLTKVFVGPNIEKDKLEVAIPHLKEITGLRGRLSPFTVE